MRIKDTFERFSRRKEARAQAKEEHEVPVDTRIRVVLLCDKIFGEKGCADEFWSKIGEHIRLRHPREFQLDPWEPRKGPVEFLSRCDGPRFLDFLEDIFQVDVHGGTHYQDEENLWVRSLNEIFDVDDLPHQLTPYHETLGEKVPGEMGRRIFRTFPKVILRESQVLYAAAVQPVLTLLQEPGFENANEEYIKAQTHFLKGEYRDALTMSTTALESVLKVICHQKGWKYDQKDAAAKLIDRFVDETGLDGFFKQGLLLGPQIRNARSFSHGAGVQKKIGTRHMAQLALNLTASAILFLVEEAKNP